jgi:hypothetical protein
MPKALSNIKEKIFGSGKKDHPDKKEDKKENNSDRKRFNGN